MKYVINAKGLSRLVAASYAENNLGPILSFPEMITVTTTLNCNYRCRMCYQASYDSKEIPWEIVEKLEDALPFVPRMQIFGGEPLLYSRFDDLVSMGARNAVKMVTITNGSLLLEERRRRMVDAGFFNVKVSFDAGTPGTYKKIRGGNYNKVIGNILELSKLKAQKNTQYPIIEMQMVAMRSNIHELGTLLSIASNIGVKHVNVFYLVTSDETLVDESLFFHQEYADEQMRRASEIANKLQMGLTLPRLFGQNHEPAQCHSFVKCKDPWNVMLVSPAGIVSPCCGGAPSVGSLAEKDFMQVWNGAEYVRLRELVNTPNQPEYCNKCHGKMLDHRSIFAHIKNSELAETLLAKTNQEAVPAS